MSGASKAKGKIKEGVVLLLDVGAAVGINDENGQSFLESSKKCASRIVQRKIFSGANDEFSLVLIGSEDTKNELDYPNICVKNSYFCSANWNLLKEVSNLSVADSNSANSDWLDGLIVAINLLRNEDECKAYSTKKIVLFSNLACPIASTGRIENTIDALKDLQISLVVIGPESELDNSENEDTPQAQRMGLAFMNRILEETEGVMCGFEEAMAQLGRSQKVQSRAQPWYCDLQIGTGIFIPVVGYKKFVTKKLLDWKKKSVDNTAITEERVHFEGDQQVDKADVIKSYAFGQTIVPFSEDDKAAIALQTEKCLQVIGFTKKKNVPIHIFLGDSVLYIAPTPRNGSEGATTAISAMARVLLDQEMVAIVRKVYRNNTAPLLGALVPTCETMNNKNCHFFYWVQLPFAEDERPIKLPSLKREKPTQEQYNAVNNLIDSMDLSQLDDEDDPYKLPVNPVVEHVNELITFKALNPSSPIPQEPSENVKNLLKPLPDILENASEALEQIKRLFPLEEIVQKTYRRAAADVFNRTSINTPADEVAPQTDVGSVVSFVQSTVTEVGTIDPEGNFLKLLEKGEPFGNLCEQVQNAIKKLIFTSSSSVGAEKAISAQKLLREHCVAKNPATYNVFVSSLKDHLVERGNTDLWDVIVQERLGLISSEESQQSSVSPDEALVFYEMKKSESQSEVQYEMEVEDLLDEL